MFVDGFDRFSQFPEHRIITDLLTGVAEEVSNPPPCHLARFGSPHPAQLFLDPPDFGGEEVACFQFDEGGSLFVGQLAYANAGLNSQNDSN